MATTKNNAAAAKSDPAAAAKLAQAANLLAAEINAVSDGCATANGGTVSLTRGVEVKKTLTVPAGVTLDLTGYGARGDNASLELQNGAVLTVNGTINTMASRIYLGGNARSAAINGSGTIILKGGGSLLWLDKSVKFTIDGVTLIGVPDNTQQLVGVYNGAELIMKSGKITGNTNKNGDQGGGVQVAEGSTFIMKGGEISGNNAIGLFPSGGGVLVGGTFTMEGGKISGNTVKGDKGKDENGGGGVCVKDGGAFTMKGGEISGNSAKVGGNLSVLRSGSPAKWGTAKWGKGGKYTKAGAAQTGGTDIGSTDDKLIAN